MEKASVWVVALVLIASLQFYLVFLWSILRRDRLAVDLMLLDVELRSLLAAEPNPAIERLGRFLAGLRRLSGVLAYSRIVLAQLLLPSAVREQMTCRQQLGSIADGELRSRAVNILDAVENAVARRMLWGSPLLWVVAALAWTVQRFRPDSTPRQKGLARFIPGLPLLEATVPMADPWIV